MRIADMHCDTISVLWKEQKQGRSVSLRENDGHIDLLRLKRSGYLVQNFALFVDKEAVQDSWEQVLSLLAVFEEEMKSNEELVAPVKSYEDILETERQGRMAALLTVEEGAVCKGEIEKLRTLYQRGVRMLTLTWNYSNELGYPNFSQELRKKIGEDEGHRREALRRYLNTPETEKGLTERGKEFVAEMEQLGMIPDVSHLSDAGFYDVLRSTKKPFVASHSNARSVCPCVRNMTDDMIRALAERGGVMGLNYCADFLTQVDYGVKNPGTMEAVVVHARHIVNTGGIEVLGLGSDFDGIDTNQGIPGAQSMGALADALLAGGFHESQVDKIMGENVLRVYRECLH